MPSSWYSGTRTQCCADTPGGYGTSRPTGCGLLPRVHLARQEIPAILGKLLTRVPDIRAAGEPDYLLSSFINGIKHLRCEFG